MSQIDRRTTILKDALEAVGQTPCIRLNRVPKMNGLKCEVVAKCEFFNPGGSVKDRIGKQMFVDAQESGRMKPGDNVIEATSGNTGIGMSMSAAVLGYNMTIALPTKMSHEKEVTLKALGANVIRTPMVPSEHPDSLISVAKRYEAEHGYHFLNQYTNESNWKSHYEGTGKEIFEQCGGKIDMVVLGTGTGGTMTGVAKFLKEKIPGVIVVGVDPHGSILADPDAPAEDVAYQVEGIGYDFVPGVCHRQYVDKWVKTGDVESFRLARELLKHEGLLVGGSCGSAMAGVVEAAKDLREDQRCVVLFADGIRNYLSKYADDNWMIEKGFMTGEITRPTYDSLLKENAELKAKLEALERK